LKRILVDKNILLISPESWDHIHLSKHHYAKELARKNRVFFLNPPGKFREIRSVPEGLIVVDYVQKYKGKSRFPKSIASRLVQRELIALESFLKVHFDIIWNFDTSRFFNLSRIKSKFKIAHIVDLDENINRDDLCKTSDVCFCTTHFIRDEVLPFNLNTTVIHHAFNASLLESKVKAEKQGKISVGYAGNLSIHYLDHALLLALAAEYPSIDFWFMGPLDLANTSLDKDQIEKLKKLKSLSNSHFTGKLSSKEVFNQMKHMDILILAYQHQRYYKQLASPHKVMEYLATGKPVLSFQMEEYRNTTGLIEMVGTREEYLIRFHEMVTHLEQYQQKQKMDNRINFALDHTYTKQLEKIDSFVEKFLEK
jgi:glycosyltransferase involved in cell wall biosynthesis